MAVPDRKDMTRVFKALAVENRVEIVRLLSERTLCVGALSDLLDISAGAVSQHLRILKDAGIVEPDRRGYFIHYSLAPGALEGCREIVESLFGKKTGTKKGDRPCAMERQSAKGRTS
ncbi:MAG: metalloregulator ArsR/SmtB family transcription factor [Thermodesulfobacteriota bacterium]|nr:metalloregulator ArsR/SmtB family transcription factor [Thermodesulfobacteriota bacterium]